METFIYSLSELNNAAEWIISKAKNYSIIAFEGEMGLGKSTLIQAICACFKIDGKANSPSYSLVNEYKSPVLNKTIYHFDFYRINTEQEATEIGFHEYIDSENLCLIEWPKKVSQLLSKEKVLYIKLNFTEENKRVLQIN